MLQPDRLLFYCSSELCHHWRTCLLYPPQCTNTRYTCLKAAMRFLLVAQPRISTAYPAWSQLGAHLPPRPSHLLPLPERSVRAHFNVWGRSLSVKIEVLQSCVQCVLNLHYTSCFTVTFSSSMHASVVCRPRLQGEHELVPQPLPPPLGSVQPSRCAPV